MIVIEYNYWPMYQKVIRERSGSVVECFDSRLKGRWFEPHWRHCVVMRGPGIFVRGGGGGVQVSLTKKKL